MIRSSLFVAALALAACGPSVSTLPQPEFAQRGIAFFGSGPDDIWTSGAVRHFDGSRWRNLEDSFPVKTQYSLAHIGGGKAWAVAMSGDAPSFGLLGSDGTFEDHTSELPADVRLRKVHHHAGQVVLTGTDADGALQVYRRKDNALVRLPTPPLTQAGSAVRVGPGEEVWLSGDSDAAQFAVPGRLPAPAGLRFDGTAWHRVDVPVEALNSRWPVDDVWFGCEPGGGLHFDGVLVRPLTVRLPLQRSCRFVRGPDGPAILFERPRGMADEPEVYGCDYLGNCEQIDVPGSVEVELVHASWSDAGWVNEKVVLSYTNCAGAACGYHSWAAGDGRYAGELDDGSLLYMSTSEGVSSLSLIRP